MPSEEQTGRDTDLGTAGLKTWFEQEDGDTEETEGDVIRNLLLIIQVQDSESP